MCELNRISRSVVPLPVHGAQGDGPQIRAETGQLGNIVGHLQQHVTQKSSLKAHFYNQVHHFYHGTCGITHLPSWHALSVFVELVDVGAEGLEVRDDKLLPEGLSQQDDVALDTPETGGRDLVRTQESCFYRLWACFSFLQHFIHQTEERSALYRWVLSTCSVVRSLTELTVKPETNSGFTLVTQGRKSSLNWSSSSHSSCHWETSAPGFKHHVIKWRSVFCWTCEQTPVHCLHLWMFLSEHGQ